jgi:hypothetical protein
LLRLPAVFSRRAGIDHPLSPKVALRILAALGSRCLVIWHSPHHLEVPA